MRIPVKTPDQIESMRQAGRVVWEAHQEAAKLIRPGVTTAEVNAVVEAVIADHGGIPLFKGVPGEVPFPAGTCISVNSEVVHGIPGPRRLASGDIVSVDVGVKLDGWCGDAAVTHPVGEIAPEVQRLLTVAEGALRLAIRTIRPGLRWSEVGRALERHVVKAGFHVVYDLLGHGIGRELWEEPEVPNYPPERADDFKLRPGMVLAVEPMVAMGTSEVQLLADHWTYETVDGSPCAHFEHTLAVTEDGVRALTAGPDGSGWGL